MHRLRRLPFRSLAASVPVLALLAAFSPAAGASVSVGASGAAHSASLSARAAVAARAALKNLEVGQHATDHRVAGHSPALRGLSQVASTNWSGYADDNSAGSIYSTVTGSWTEPAVNCPSHSTQLAAFWVGIDGYSSGSVEQDGTLVECYHRAAYYYTWWEMYPSNAIQVVGSTLRPGDAITASVIRSGSSYTLKVTDSSNPANSFSTTQYCSNCANSSAEWIAEAPSGNRGVYPLADFGTWTASGATVNSGVISSFPDDEITMVDNSGAVKAQPGPLNSSGNGFSVTWERSS